MFVDTHCHLYMGSWTSDLDKVIDLATNTNIEKIICPGIDIDSSIKCIKISENYPNVFAAVGIHPHEAEGAPQDFIDTLCKFRKNPKVVAIGEMGLDFYRNFSDEKSQRKVFIEQLQLSKELNLPVIVHNRNADKEVIQILTEYSPIKGVAHCFSSDLLTAEKLLDLGLYISFAGNLTYKNSQLVQVASAIPLNRILIETDAPFLSPEPVRGKENSPNHLVHIAEKLADCKNLTINEIAKDTSQNAEKLFKLRLA